MRACSRTLFVPLDAKRTKQDAKYNQRQDTRKKSVKKKIGLAILDKPVDFKLSQTELN